MYIYLVNHVVCLIIVPCLVHFFALYTMQQSMVDLHYILVRINLVSNFCDLQSRINI